MEMSNALALLAATGIGFEVVYDGDDEQCPICQSRETQKAA